jgi:hypothetical protein
MIDVWRTLVGARQTMDDATFDAGTLIQTRERRRIVGDVVISYVDQIAGHKYPDSVVLGDAPCWSSRVKPLTRTRGAASSPPGSPRMMV